MHTLFIPSLIQKWNWMSLALKATAELKLNIYQVFGILWSCLNVLLGLTLQTHRVSWSLHNCAQSWGVQNKNFLLAPLPSFHFAFFGEAALSCLFDLRTPLLLFKLQVSPGCGNILCSSELTRTSCSIFNYWTQQTQSVCLPQAQEVGAPSTFVLTNHRAPIKPKFLSAQPSKQSLLINW